MADVKVYLYDYFDGMIKRDRRSTEYAMAESIAARRGTIIAESERIVDEDLIHEDGSIRATDIPLPDDEETVEIPRKRAPRETRLGRS